MQKAKFVSRMQVLQIGTATFKVPAKNLQTQPLEFNIKKYCLRSITKKSSDLLQGYKISQLTKSPKNDFSQDFVNSLPQSSKADLKNPIFLSSNEFPA